VVVNGSVVWEGYGVDDASWDSPAPSITLRNLITVCEERGAPLVGR